MIDTMIYLRHRLMPSGVANDSTSGFIDAWGMGSWRPLLARLVSSGAVDGDRGARDLVGRGVARAEEIVSSALGVEGAHAHAVDLCASVVSGLGIAAQKEGAGEDE